MKGLRTVLAVLVASVALTVALPMIVLLTVVKFVAFFVRAVGNVIEPTSVPWQDVIKFDPDLGWKPKSGLDVRYLADFDDLFKLHTDQEGWPGFTTLDESNVIVLGDSFAFGYGMDTRACFFEINPELRVKPLGAPGYSMVQPLILLHKLQQRLRNKLVIWFVFLENDLYDNLMPYFLHYRAPFVRQANGERQWELVTEHIEKTDWHHTNGGRPHGAILANNCRPGKFSQRVYSGCNFILKTGRDLCTQAGAELVVLTVPSVKQLTEVGLTHLSAQSEGQPIDPDFPDRRIGKICSDHKINFVAGKNLLDGRDYKKREQIHWNNRGHKKIGEFIADLYHAHARGTLNQFIKNGTYRTVPRQRSRAAKWQVSQIDEFNG